MLNFCIRLSFFSHGRQKQRIFFCLFPHQLSFLPVSDILYPVIAVSLFSEKNGSNFNSSSLPKHNALFAIPITHTPFVGHSLDRFTCYHSVVFPNLPLAVFVIPGSPEESWHSSKNLSTIITKEAHL